MLRKMGFRLQLRGLPPHHIEALMRYWTADSGVADELAKRGAQANLQPRAHPLSAAHIQGQLSVLRTFCSWIGKAGMVRDAKHYMTPDRCHLVSRKSAAEADKSWHAAGVDFDAVYAKVRARCIYVATQLEVMMAFGLRRKEAVMFSPRLAVVPGSTVCPHSDPAKRRMQPDAMRHQRTKKAAVAGARAAFSGLSWTSLDVLI